MSWITESNRWKHLLGGILVGAGTDSLYCAIYSGAGIASALELKDKLYGNRWDWIDWGLTIIGGGVGYVIHRIVMDF